MLPSCSYKLSNDTFAKKIWLLNILNLNICLVCEACVTPALY